MAIVDSIKGILSVKIKPRHDSYSDQFSRIFLVKMMMIAALLIGMNWYSDKIACIIPGTHGINGAFVSSACWINGLYVYEKIRYHANEVGYYGIPRDINKDGMFNNGEICATTDASHKVDPNCHPMEKTFFLQYQYLTFVMAVLGLLYYSPYGLFRLINQDMVSLKGSVDDGKAEPIVNNYFNYKVNSQYKLRMRVLGNIFIKILYIIVNVVALLVIDGILNGRFIGYGVEWMDWSKLSNAMAYDYMGIRHYPKPGNALIPSFAFCEVHQAAQDIKSVVINKHRFVCELSQHILYQYVFIIVWFAMIVGIVISCLGLLLQLIDHAITITCFQRSGPNARKMYQELTLRECEYLEFMRRKNMPLYGEVVQKLKDERMGDDCPDCKKEGAELLNYRGIKV